jgi:antitoxin component of RelBE/YafQ-DinJ toxin-antitoxin module
MAKTAMTYTRITPEIKTEAERIICSWGLTPITSLNKNKYFQKQWVFDV